ncbi:DUF1501 domain-containing protein [Pseudoponticoccus marisrubri]|uniref:Twin-arginine translocation pathway signal n=1 Tax=Pseudoponticoccus marisrubri TaxID=1685382 RepID=A0A0W7WHW6_9RHOB|nr:DUF1501 domain-containing protein [Pseudoponticoccus marisrubri]KUF10204.1 twin-arginine translocation pathway signal [Pseudoponticoccus marisrubri]
MDRRAFLTRSAALGCSLAASPLVTPMSFAAAPGEGRLVVILLRGGMDGLATVMPHGDPGFAALRPAPDFETDLDLGGGYALAGALGGLAPLWQAGQLGVVHAVSTPYRDKRSHFDGQDLLEAGGGDPRRGLPRDGWLNRLVQSLPGATAQTAYAVGHDPLAILGGAAEVQRWAPESDLALSPQAIRLAGRVMQDDPAMAAALQAALRLADGDGDAVAVPGGEAAMMDAMMQDMTAARGGGHHARLAGFAADRLREEARIASFSLNGWDTHANQARGLNRALGVLAETITALRDGLGGPVWRHTAVVAVTEFGRTVRLNGSGGTDHGTGGAMLLAGGAIRGGRVVTDWPGLAEADLYDRRDLRPTRDLRAHLGWLIRGLYGIDRATIERVVFPGLEMGRDPGLLL